VREHEKVERNLQVGSVGARVAKFRLPAVSRSSGVVRVIGGGGPVREGSMGKSGSTSSLRATCLEPPFGRRRGGKWGSTARSSGGANGVVQPFYRHTRGGGAGRGITEGGVAGTRSR
jgi:hypothetical protein